jgi:hypothetical protein
MHFDHGFSFWRDEGRYGNTKDGMGTQKNKTGNACAQWACRDGTTAHVWESWSHPKYSNIDPVARGISLKVWKNPRSSAQVRRHKTLANEYQIVVESRSFLSFGTTTWL